MFWKILGGILGGLVKKPEAQQYQYTQPVQNDSTKILFSIAAGIAAGYLINKHSKKS